MVRIIMGSALAICKGIRDENYIKRRRESINDRKLQTDLEIKKYFQDKIDNKINSISYLRLFRFEFFFIRILRKF
jgi:hypothetical protein